MMIGGGHILRLLIDLLILNEFNVLLKTGWCDLKQYAVMNLSQSAHSGKSCAMTRYPQSSLTFFMMEQVHKKLSYYFAYINNISFYGL